MIDTKKLKGIIYANGLTQGILAKELGITDSTFTKKIKRGIFKQKEIEYMIYRLHIDNPTPIFFAKDVT